MLASTIAYVSRHFFPGGLTREALERKLSARVEPSNRRQSAECRSVVVSWFGGSKIVVLGPK